MVVRMHEKARGGRFDLKIPRAPAAALPPRRGDDVSLVHTANPRARVAPTPTARTNKQPLRAASAVIPPFARNGKAPFHRQPQRSAQPWRRTADVSVNSAATVTPDGIAKSPLRPYIACKSRQKSRQSRMRAPYWRPFRFVYPPREDAKTKEKNHAEKAGTELRIRHV